MLPFLAFGVVLVFRRLVDGGVILSFDGLKKESIERGVFLALESVCRSGLWVVAVAEVAALLALELPLANIEDIEGATGSGFQVCTNA